MDVILMSGTKRFVEEILEEREDLRRFAEGETVYLKTSMKDYLKSLSFDKLWLHSVDNPNIPNFAFADLRFEKIEVKGVTRIRLTNGESSLDFDNVAAVLLYKGDNIVKLCLICSTFTGVYTVVITAIGAKEGENK